MEEIAARLPRSGINVIVSSVETVSWTKNGKRLLHSCLSLWNQWPDVPASAKLIICLKMEYTKVKQKSADELRTDQNPVGITLKKLRLSDYSKIRLLILPVLQKVTWTDVEEWIDRAEVCNLLKDEDRILQLKERLRRLYRNQQAISMEQLSPKLESILEEFV